MCLRFNPFQNINSKVATCMFTNNATMMRECRALLDLQHFAREPFGCQNAFWSCGKGWRSGSPRSTAHSFAKGSEVFSRRWRWLAGNGKRPAGQKPRSAPRPKQQRVRHQDRDRVCNDSESRVSWRSLPHRIRLQLATSGPTDKFRFRGLS
jgi:hypothetical protein